MCDRDQPLVIFTIGHSTRSRDDFISLLETHAITGLADIRTVPRSRRHPHFTQDALCSTLPLVGIAYRHFPRLGGFRKPRPDSTNTAWRHEGFRGFADYMQTPAFECALDELMAFATAKQVSASASGVPHPSPVGVTPERAGAAPAAVERAEARATRVGVGSPQVEEKSSASGTGAPHPSRVGATPERDGARVSASGGGAPRVVIMCAEAVWWRCHRQLVADALVARGIEVRHIMSIDQAPLHELTEFARLIDGKPTYPALV